MIGVNTSFALDNSSGLNCWKYSFSWKVETVSTCYHVTLAGQWRYEKTNKNRELSYAAIVISYAAKKLASSTWDAVNNFDEYQQLYNEEHRHFPCDTPMLDLNSFDINWKAVPISCLDKIFEYSNRLEIKQ